MPLLSGMAGAKHYSELIAWQLADQLRVQTLTLTARPRFVKDLKLNSQTEDAVNSVCRNIAEGFGCESHIEFARFLKISRRSLNEVQARRSKRRKRDFSVLADDCGPLTHAPAGDETVGHVRIGLGE